MKDPKMTLQTLHPETITLPRRHALFIATNEFYFYIEFQLIYDNNGNLVTGDGKYREYNEFNQLVRVRAGYDENGPKLEEYLWHPTEERVLAKKVYDFNQNLEEIDIYVNENLVRVINYSAGGPDYDVVYVKDETGIVAEQKVGGERLFYHNDHLGSTTLITNSTGQVIENTFYEPFGGIVSGGSRRYDYEGKEFSDSTRDYDFHFRKYDPGLKIFTQPDSLLPNVYDPQQLNRYAFERNNPYYYVDPDGHIIPAAVALVTAAIIGAGVGLATYFISHAATDRQYSFKGALSYALGGATSATIGAAVVLTTGATLGSYMGSGALAGGISQISANIGEGNTGYQGIPEAMVLGTGAGYMGKIGQPMARTWLIKNPVSYFTTTTGQTFMSNTFYQETSYSTLNNVYNYYAYSYMSSQSNQAGTYGQSSISGGNGAHYQNGAGYYYDKSGQGYCGVPSENLSKGDWYDSRWYD